MESSTQHAIQEPKNWSQNITFSCSYADCAQLLKFLRDPKEMQHRFKMGKAKRFHLHRQLDDNSCDATHQTERIGNPQTLVVTKTRKSYQASQQKRCKELDALARLRSLYSKPVNSAHEDPLQKGRSVPM